MTKNSYIIPIVCLIVISSLVIIVYNTHMLMKNVEAFTDHNTRHSSVTSVTNRCLPDKLISTVKHRYYNFRDVKESVPLRLMGCLIEDYTDSLLSELRSICYTSYQEFNSTSKSMIYDKIMDDLRKTKGTDELLSGPVYVIVYEDNSDDEYEKFTRLVMIYPKYPKEAVTGNRLQRFFNKHIYSVKNPDCKATIHKINKYHKMFNKVM